MTRVPIGALMFVLALTAGGCDEQLRPKRQTEPNRPSIGFIDQPTAQAVVGPLFTVAGWALDESNVQRVRVYLDDELAATIPLTVLRPDVDAALSVKSGAGTPHGFTAVIDAGSRAGYCTIRLEAMDGRGALTQVATVNVKIEP